MRRWLVFLCLLMMCVPATAQSFWEGVTDAWLVAKVAAACDYSNPVTRAFAMDAAGPSRSGELTLTQVCNIFDAIIRPHWTYFHDPQRTRFGEDVAYASESIRVGLRGDCDDFAVLMAACIRAIGGACRIALVHDGARGHAFAEVYVGDIQSANKAADYILRRYAKHYRVGNSEYFIPNRVFFDLDGGGGCWLALDWSGTPPSWSDAFPGRTPLISPSTAKKVVYVPLFSFWAVLQGASLPTPSVP